MSDNTLKTERMLLYNLQPPSTQIELHDYRLANSKANGLQT